MGAETVEVEGKDWRTIFAKWLANQGVPTVLLFLILGGLGHIAYIDAPLVLQQIQEGYERLQAKQDAQIKSMVESHAKEFQSHREQTDRLVDIIRGNDRPIGARN